MGKSKNVKVLGRFEALEDRRVLASGAGMVSLIGSELVICGTDASEQIVVLEDDDRIIVVAGFLDSSEIFNASEVGSISISAGGGNDTVVASSVQSASVTIDGQAGNDRLFGTEFADTIFGGAGNDQVFAGRGDDKIHGGTGDDILRGGRGNDTIRGEDGIDTVYGGIGNDSIEGNDGDDNLFGDIGNDVIHGGSGMDRLMGGFGQDDLNGGAEADVLVGADGFDRLDGGFGQDTLLGGANDDVLMGGQGSDVIIGGTGNDELAGAGGNDQIIGGSGSDHLEGGDGNDQVLGGSGADLLMGGDGNDRLIGGNGTDVLSGGRGSDSADGGDDRDIVIGGDGADSIGGGGGDDVVVGGSTAIDGDLNALETAVSDWATGGGYDSRRALVQAVLRPSATGDQSDDSLSGGRGQDWFVASANEDAVSDLATDETNGLEFVASDDNFTVVVGESLDGNVLVNDADPAGGGLTIDTTAVAPPSQGTLELRVDGSFTYTPDSDATGTDSFVYRAIAGSDTDDATVEISILVNTGPTAVNDEYTFNEDSTLVTLAGANDLLVNDDPGSGTNLVVTTTPVVDVSNGQLTLNSDGTFSYTPNSNFSGTDGFIYEIINSDGEIARGQATFTINAVNDAPVAVDDVYLAVAGEVLTVDVLNGVLANDTDVEGDSLVASIGGLPEGTLTLSADGGFTFTSPADFTGPTTFTYTLSDGTDSDVGTVTINVESSSVPNEFSITSNAANGDVVGTVTPADNVSGEVVFEFEKDARLGDASVLQELELRPDDHYVGNPDASVLLIEYVDFACPICGLFHEPILQVQDRFNGEVAVVTRHLPLSPTPHPNARVAAIAAEAAGRQGQFDEYVDLLFTNRTSSNWDDASDPTILFETFARQLGLDITQFRADRTDPALADRVDRDRTGATNVLGFGGTPSFVVNDFPANGVLDPNIASVNTLLEQRLELVDSPFALNRFNGEIRVRDASLITEDSYTLNIITNGELVTVTIDVSDIG